MTNHDSDSQAEETRTHRVRECPRCGDDHGDAAFRRLERPVTVADSSYEWWWPCPATQAPVLAHLAMEAT